MLSQRKGEMDNEIPRKLIEAASEEFARHGYAAARVRDIVRTADVNLAAVNYYFGGKEGLYAATLKELASRRRAEAEAEVQPGEDAAQGLRRQVSAMLHRFVDGESRSALGRILAHESMNPTYYFEQLITDAVRPELERLAETVRRLMGPAAAEEAVRANAMSVMGQCLFYLFARGAVDRVYPGIVKPGDCERLAEHITAFSLAGIARRL
jgi:AcrR family transcriptional regulator